MIGAVASRLCRLAIGAVASRLCRLATPWLAAAVPSFESCCDTHSSAVAAVPLVVSGSEPLRDAAVPILKVPSLAIVVSRHAEKWLPSRWHTVDNVHGYVGRRL